MKNYFEHREIDQKFIDLLDENGIDWELIKWGNTDVLHFQLHDDGEYKHLRGEYYGIKP